MSTRKVRNSRRRCGRLVPMTRPARLRHQDKKLDRQERRAEAGFSHPPPLGLADLVMPWRSPRR